MSLADLLGKAEKPKEAKKEKAPGVKPKKPKPKKASIKKTDMSSLKKFGKFRPIGEKKND